MKRNSSIFSLILIFLIWLGLTLGCANNNNQLNSQQPANSNSQVSNQPAIKRIVDIPQLVRQTTDGIG